MDTQPPAPKFPWGAVIGIVVLALVGIAMLAYAIYGLLGGSEAGVPTQVAIVPTRAVIIPTTTPAPTQPPATDTPAAPTATSGPALTIVSPANVRSGPGTNYPVIGGLQPNQAVTVIGRSSNAQWYVISFGASGSGRGWVSNIVASYSGDTNSLPVITAPPPPPPTNTPIPTNTPLPPATNAPAGYSSQGIVGNYFRVENTNAIPGGDIWFDFKVTNVTDSTVNYSILAAHTESGQSAQSWTNEKLGPHQVLEWRDHINLPAGTYQMYLGICYGGVPACLANTAPWDRLSGSTTVIVQ